MSVDAFAAPDEVEAAEGALPALFRGLHDGIRRYLCPPTEALLGVRPLVPGRDVVPPAFEPCWLCGAIRDEYGRILRARTVYPALGVQTTFPTGIHEGDPLACAACCCLEPKAEKRAPHRGKPVGQPIAKATPPPRLNAKDRRSLSRRPAGRVWLAMKDAEAAGDMETAGRLQTLIYRMRDGDIDELGMGSLAGLLTEDEMAEYQDAAEPARQHCEV